MNRLDLHTFIREHAISIQNPLCHSRILEFLETKGIPSTEPITRNKVSQFIKTYKKKWADANRTVAVFLETNSLWLASSFIDIQTSNWETSSRVSFISISFRKKES